MDSTYLAHHGIKGQKWGVRRYQNEDGTLTAEGRKHYGYSSNGMSEHTMERIRKGTKIGAAVGAVTAAAELGATLAPYAAAGMIVSSPAAIAITGATYIAQYALSGYIHGMAYGAIVGAIETKQARKLMTDKELLQTKIDSLYESDEKDKY